MDREHLKLFCEAVDAITTPMESGKPEKISRVQAAALMVEIAKVVGFIQAQHTDMTLYPDTRQCANMTQ